MAEIVESLVPRTKATNAYELLDEVAEAIREEPKRLDMSYWIRPPARLEFDEAPACGTVGCIAGWINILVDGPHETLSRDCYFLGIKRRALEILGFGYFDEPNLHWVHPSVSWFFHGDVKDQSGSYVDVGDERYVPLVIDRIRDFQQLHEAALKAKAV